MKFLNARTGLVEETNNEELIQLLQSAPDVYKTLAEVQKEAKASDKGKNKASK